MPGSDSDKSNRKFFLCALVFVCVAAWRGRDGERTTEIRPRLSVIEQKVKAEEAAAKRPFLVFNDSKERDTWDQQFEHDRLLDSMTVVMDHPELSSARDEPNMGQ
jgi:hypothetical protein